MHIKQCARANGCTVDQGSRVEATPVAGERTRILARPHKFLSQPRRAKANLRLLRGRQPFYCSPAQIDFDIPGDPLVDRAALGRSYFIFNRDPGI
jgi:hypothetical protein